MVASHFNSLIHNEVKTVANVPKRSHYKITIHTERGSHLIHTQYNIKDTQRNTSHAEKKKTNKTHIKLAIYVETYWTMNIVDGLSMRSVKFRTLLDDARIKITVSV